MCATTSMVEKNNMARYAGLGFQMLATIGLGIWGGIALDAYLSCKPIFTVVGSLLGLGISLYQVISDYLRKEN